MYTRTETGVMVIKDGAAWGIVYKDGQVAQYGWLHPSDKNVEIYKRSSCRVPTDVLLHNSPCKEEMSCAVVVPVKRTINIECI
ncbi:MAG: hypothetical protein DRO67_01190 [Candidatus Asgardarchaeum californiense]|nr:MAG: hypothetical protein DRO67_01190 [Candidatus Asgardarchaeum californiense]